MGLNIGQIDTKGIRLSFWDLGGQEELQSLWDKVCFALKLAYLIYVVYLLLTCLQYYAESHALIYVVDSADRDRIPESKSAFGKLISSLLVVNIFIFWQSRR